MRWLKGCGHLMVCSWELVPPWCKTLMALRRDLTLWLALSIPAADVLGFWTFSSVPVRKALNLSTPYHHHDIHYHVTFIIIGTTINTLLHKESAPTHDLLTPLQTTLHEVLPPVNNNNCSKGCGLVGLLGPIYTWSWYSCTGSVRSGIWWRLWFWVHWQWWWSSEVTHQVWGDCCSAYVGWGSLQVGFLGQFSSVQLTLLRPPNTWYWCLLQPIYPPSDMRLPP